MTSKTGKVKWFDPAKGFGFVTDDDGGSDILLHVNVLKDYGVSSVVEGAVVSVETIKTERGYQVTSLMSLLLPKEDNNEISIKTVDKDTYVKKPFLPARTKWYDRVKGFGFVNIFGSDDDVFIYIEVLQSCGMAEIVQGEAICVKVSNSPRGKIVVDIRAWSVAN